MGYQNDEEKLIISVGELRQLLSEAQRASRSFSFANFLDSDNLVEMAKTEFPRLEAKVAMHTELQQTQLATYKQMEQTKRLLIIVAGVCLLAGGALLVFAPQGKEGVSYIVASTLTILSLGAIGIQEFRLKTLGVNVGASTKAIKVASNDIESSHYIDFIEGRDDEV